MQQCASRGAIGDSEPPITPAAAVISSTLASQGGWHYVRHVSLSPYLSFEQFIAMRRSIMVDRETERKTERDNKRGDEGEGER